MKNFKKLIGFMIVFMVVMVTFCSVSFAATVGQQLTSPESGWIRYDDTDSNIVYTGRWSRSPGSDCYKNALKYTTVKGDTCKIKFKGTKLRIISKVSSYSSMINISIDGVVETFSERGTEIGQVIVYEKTNLNNIVHSVVITTATSEISAIDAIDIDDTGYLVSISPLTNLNATAIDKTVNLSWNTVEGATSYNIKRATTAGGPYTTIGVSTTNAYSDTTVTNDTTYYYVVSAVVSETEGTNSNEVSATPKNASVSLDVTSVDKAKVGDEIIANVVIHNATNICAEDIKLAFDTTKLEFVSAESADGIKIYKDIDLTSGIRRYITASLGKANAANGDKILLKLKFKATAIGDAKIDITTGRIADNATLEMDLTDESCGEKTIIIGTGDVNRTGEYTLLDLGIDAWLYGDAVTDEIKEKYDADQDANGTVDDADLTELVKQILNNTNYPVKV